MHARRFFPDFLSPIEEYHIVQKPFTKRQQSVLKNVQKLQFYNANGDFKTPGKVIRTKNGIYSQENVETCNRLILAYIEFVQKVLCYETDYFLPNPLKIVMDYGPQYNNAHFDGEFMLLGGGDGSISCGFSHDITVISHELSHAVIDRILPDFSNQGTSGAIQEHYADMLSICCMHYTQHTKSTPSQISWMIGQDCVIDGSLRSFSNEPARNESHVFGKDDDPRHMDNFYSGPIDHNGVHINCTILNHLFYQFCTTSKRNTWEEPLSIWIDTLVSSDIPHDLDFSDFGRLLFQKATSYDTQHKTCYRFHVHLGLLAVGLPI